MQTLKRALTATFLLFSPLVQAEGLQDQLTAFLLKSWRALAMRLTLPCAPHRICTLPVTNRHSA